MSNSSSIIWTTILGLLWFVLSIMSPPECSYENLDVAVLSEPLTKCRAYAIFFNYRGYLGAGLTAVFVLLNFYYLSVEGTRTKKTINNFLRHFINENLEGDIGSNRITVFTTTTCRGALFYFIRSTFMNSGYFLKRNCLMYRLRCCPIWGRKYLVVYARVGNPNHDKRSTIFKVPSNESEINRIVPQTAYRGVNIKVHTTKILADEIAQYEKISDIKSQKLKRDVKAYMRDGAIKDFGRLKMIRRFSTNIWACPLFINADEGASHVIVFDSDLVEQVFERENFLGKINDLAKNIHILLSNK